MKDSQRKAMYAKRVREIDQKIMSHELNIRIKKNYVKDLKKEKKALSK